MIPERIGVIEGPWCDSDYFTVVKPHLTQAGLSFVRQQMLPIYHLYDRSFWGALQSVNPIDFAVLDSRFWRCSDDVFQKYIEQVATIPFRAVGIFESPFGHERPPEMDWTEYEEIVLKRVRMACRLLKQSQPQTLCVAPPIAYLPQDARERHLDLLIQTRSDFDVYSLHFFYEISEHTLGFIAGLLNQVITALSKPVWVTRWGVPVCDYPIENPWVIGANTFTPYTQAEAIAKVSYLYRQLDGMLPDRSKWFLTTTGRDVYNPSLKPPNPFMCENMIVRENIVPNVWSESHFLGMIDHRSQLKNRLLSHILSLQPKTNHV